MDSEKVHECMQNAENGFGFDTFGAIPQRWQWIFHHILHRTGDETCLSFMVVETKEQSTLWICAYQTSQNSSSIVCQKSDNCFLRQERSADGGIHTSRDRNVRSVLQNCIMLFRTKGTEC